MLIAGSLFNVIGALCPVTLHALAIGDVALSRFAPYEPVYYDFLPKISAIVWAQKARTVLI